MCTEAKSLILSDLLAQLLFVCYMNSEGAMSTVRIATYLYEVGNGDFAYVPFIS